MPPYTLYTTPSLETLYANNGAAVFMCRRSAFPRASERSRRNVVPVWPQLEHAPGRHASSRRLTVSLRAARRQTSCDVVAVGYVTRDASLRAWDDNRGATSRPRDVGRMKSTRLRRRCLARRWLVHLTDTNGARRPPPAAAAAAAAAAGSANGGRWPAGLDHWTRQLFRVRLAPDQT